MISQTILYPAYRNRVDLLLGVQCTLAGRRTREPAAGKVVLEFLGRAIDIRRALHSCGLFAPAEGAIPRTIAGRLDNRLAPDEFVLIVSDR
ncbi:hypothetical protein BH23PSE1_BH23PSE1_08920 [soil metagenome]